MMRDAECMGREDFMPSQGAWARHKAGQGPSSGNLRLFMLSNKLSNQSWPGLD